MFELFLVTRRTFKAGLIFTGCNEGISSFDFLFIYFFTLYLRLSWLLSKLSTQVILLIVTYLLCIRIFMSRLTAAIIHMGTAEAGSDDTFTGNSQPPQGFIAL